jgi:hypothetical protein
MFLNEYHQFQIFFLIINIKILFNCGKELCTFDNEKKSLKKNINHNYFEHKKSLLTHYQLE